MGGLSQLTNNNNKQPYWLSIGGQHQNKFSSLFKDKCILNTKTKKTVNSYFFG